MEGEGRDPSELGGPELERLALRLRTKLPQTADAEERVMALNQFLFDELGYRGNVDEYYDPRNSYLNEVMERRTGIPITLAILYMELGRRIGLPLEGVSFPGHFLVRLRLRGKGLPLAKAVEAIGARNEDELRALIKSTIENRMAVGALKDTDLTLHDLDVIEDSFTTTLRGIYHPRIQYPKTEGEIKTRPAPYRVPDGNTPPSSSVIEPTPTEEETE